MKSFALVALCVTSTALAQVSAVVATPPLPGGPTAHDVAVWVHPTDVSKSQVFSTNDLGGLLIYALDGGQLALASLGLTKAVDVRYRVPLGTGRTDVLLSVDTGGVFRLLAPSPTGGQPVLIDEGAVSAGFPANAAALYFNPVAQQLSVFVGSAGGQLAQFTVSDNDAGQLRSTLARTLSLTRSIDGLAADDRTGQVFFTLATRGLYRLPAGADAGDIALEVDSLDAGHLVNPAGVAFHFGAGTSGNLIVSSATTANFAVYGLPSLAFVRTFSIVADGGVPGVFGSSAIEAVTLNLGGPYANGFFVAADPANINNKFVRWEDIAREAPALVLSPTLDPRTSWGLAPGAPVDAGLCPIPDGGTDAGADAGALDGGCTPGGTGGGSGGTGGSGGIIIPGGSGGGGEEPKTGCGCGGAVMLSPFAILIWMLRPLRRRRL